MLFSAIEQLLQERMGLHSATVGSSTVVQAVEERMLACDISDPHDYLKVISHSITELDALIDAVVIPETWFYRDQHPFSAFSEWVSGSWLPHNKLSPLRVLSVPCSTGEEPYTLAMCLADLGLPARAAEINAIDISHRNIEKAGAAIYGDNSFRSKDLSFRDRHFVSDGQKFKLKDDIRARVNFFRANILDDTFIKQQQPYHVIFCRNLLIYFDRPTQNRAIERLEQLLTRDGALFLGHAETSLMLERDFEALSYPRCFGFKREHDKPTQSQPTAVPRAVSIKTRQRPEATSEANTPRPFAGVVQKNPPTQATAPGKGKVNGPEGDREGPLEGKVNGPEGDREGPLEGADRLLGDAFQLADQGHLDEAARCCETLLRQQYHLADAHFLLGLVREAAGSIEDAEQMFRKTTYLDPNHYEALTHLSMICRQQGDAVSAQRFQQRAARAQQRSQVEEKRR